MTLTDREKALEKAARDVCYNGDQAENWERLQAALRPSMSRLSQNTTQCRRGMNLSFLRTSALLAILSSTESA